VTTDSAGIATAPVLTANNIAGNFTATAAAGTSGTAAFPLTNLPVAAGPLQLSLSRLDFVSELNDAAPPVQNIRVYTTDAASTWTAVSSSPWLLVSPSSGTTPTQVAVSVNPSNLALGAYTGMVTFTSPGGGVASLFVTYTITNKPVLTIAPPALLFFSVVAAAGTRTAPPAQTLNTTSNSRTIAYTISTEVSTPAAAGWLRISTARGQTPGSVQVSVNPAGLADGIYEGSVRFTPTESAISAVTVPVTLVVGCGQGCSPVLRPTILSVVNAASFHPDGSPGALMTIFGTGLSDSVYQAASFPLPTTLGSTTVTVNGIAVPLNYVSPTQINFQMPARAPVASVQIAVIVDGGATAGQHASAEHSTALSAVDPGLFVTPDRRASALNQDLSIHTALHRNLRAPSCCSMPPARARRHPL
jgi:adhesin/invasin